MDEVVELLPIVERAAKQAAHMYGIDEDEAIGLLSLEVVERSRDYLILFEEGHTGLIARRLKNVAAVYSRGDRVKRMAETDQYYYEPEYVRLFLPFFFAIEDWENGPSPDDATGKWATGEAVDTALDIKAAWGRLKDWQTSVITVRHILRPGGQGQVDWDGVAEVIGRSNGASARRAYAQATSELTAEMNASWERRNGEHDGPGARTPFSNSAAQHTLSGDQ